ncbi:DUF262 domain-containing protein [Actinoplanes sp. NPDC048988]|uniref:DUF262 domain-containing protein n=1 Tax=Actinoplanes sp. NPDC048988 TaxID=3363901 RepID=UPI003718B933
MCAAKIEGEAFELQDLFERWSYDIDYYQREFAWSAEDVRTLVDDLISQFRLARKDHRTRRGMRHAEPYFLGPFVYHDVRRGVRFLVDGQQRFTVLHLIFIHLHHQARALERRDAEDKLNRVIRFAAPEGGWRFRIDIEERRRALQRWYDGHDFKPDAGSSLSLRNLSVRSDELRELLDSRLDAGDLASFVEWLLSRVVLVGIRAPDRDSGFRIFESMNDRGTRLTPIDLLKSFLLSHVGGGEEELNLRWRSMLAELTIARDDDSAPTRFIKAALIAQYARISSSDDLQGISRELHLWVRRHATEVLHLAEADEYFTFVDQLISLARIYRTFLSASRTLDTHHNLQALYYNEYNGLTNQMDIILAAIRPADTAETAKEKAALIANFIDRWYVIRVINDDPANAAALDELSQTLIPSLRDCKSPQDVRAALTDALPDDDDFNAILTYQLRGTNSVQVRYLLARITAFAQTGWNEPNLVTEYLNPKLWQIEHIFADKKERHPEITDPIDFRLLRNRIGVLGLLKATVNMSIKDKTVPEKIKVYRSENLLLRCMHSDYHLNIKPIRSFMERNDLKQHLRPLADNTDLGAAVLVRAELYRRLCVATWGRKALGYPPIEAEPDSVAPEPTPSPLPASSATRTPRTRPTDIQLMMRKGILAPNTSVVGHADGVEKTALIQSDGQLRLPTGDVFRKADDAARAVTGKKTDGMPFWHVERPDGSHISLRQLRNEGRPQSTPKR